MIRNKFLYLILFFLVIGIIRNLFIIDSQKEDTNDILKQKADNDAEIETLKSEIQICREKYNSISQLYDDMKAKIDSEWEKSVNEYFQSIFDLFPEEK